MEMVLDHRQRDVSKDKEMIGWMDMNDCKSWLTTIFMSSVVGREDWVPSCVIAISFLKN